MEVGHETDRKRKQDELIIRTLRQEDTPRLVKMDKEISGRSRAAWYEQKVRRALHDSDVMISLGAEGGGCLVGALLGSVHYGEFGQPEPIAILDTVLVDRACARQGIGSALLDQLIKNLKGLRISHLRTEVRWDELDLLAFFGKAGFNPVPRLVLELDLSQVDPSSHGAEEESV
jgi:GNAT superfamily N-acetyltransferase